MSRTKSTAMPIGPERVTNVTALLRQTAEAHAFLNQTNIYRPAMQDVELVSRILPLANKNSSVIEIAEIMYTTELSHDLPHSDSGYRELEQMPEFRRLVFQFWENTKDSRKWFRDALIAIIDKRKPEIRTLQSQLDGLLSHIVIVPSLSWNGKSLVREDFFYSLSLGGTLAYVLMLLLDPARNLTTALRLCRLSECERIFLSRSSGGRPPLYCSKDCKKSNDAMTSVERTRAWRKNKANKAENS